MPMGGISTQKVKNRSDIRQKKKYRPDRRVLRNRALTIAILETIVELLQCYRSLLRNVDRREHIVQRRDVVVGSVRGEERERRLLELLHIPELDERDG